ncbi:MAG: hypothetical protein PWP75_865, partial [Caldanaerobacter sp.]|nr:hypothetical protein [Caldanaerobacter sp.]
MVDVIELAAHLMALSARTAP